MSQSSAVSDFLSSSVMSLSGILAQFNADSAGNSMGNDAFSNLLANSGQSKKNSSNNLSTIADTTTVTTTSTTQNSTITGTASKDSLLAHLRDLSAALQQTIHQLRQQTENANAVGSGTATTSPAATATSQAPTTSAASDAPVRSNSTQDATNPGTTTDVAKDKTKADTVNASAGATATTTTTDTTSRDDATTTSNATADPSVSALLTALLAATQMVLQQLQQNQKNTGGLSAQADTTKTIDLSSLLNNSGGLAGSDALAKLVDLLAKTAKQVAADTTSAGDTQTASTPSLMTAGNLQTVTESQGANLGQTLNGLLDKVKNLAAAVSINGGAAASTTTVSDHVNKSASDKSPAASKADAVTNTATNVDATTNMAALSAAATVPTAPTVENNAEGVNSFFLTTARVDTGSGSDTGFDTSAHGGSSAGLMNLDSNANAATANTDAAGGARFADHIAAMRAPTATASAAQPSPVDQVIVQLNRSVKNGNDQMSLQLHPNDLGKITVKLDFSNDGKVQGTVTADNPATLEILQKDSRSLERALSDAGLRTDPGSLSFNLSSQSDQNKNQTAAGNGNGSSNTNGTLSAEDDSAAANLAVLSETYYVTPQGVNIQV